MTIELTIWDIVLTVIPWNVGLFALGWGIGFDSGVKGRLKR